MRDSAPPAARSAQRGLPVIVAVGLLLALLGALLLLVSVAGSRGGAWPAWLAPRLLAAGAWIALVGGVLSLAAAALTRPGTGRRGFGLSVAGMLIGLGLFGVARFALIG
jgi:hypothetical protein